MSDDDRLTSLATKVLDSLLGSLGYEYSCEATTTQDGLTLMIESPDARFIIGSEGDRLDDLQYLVNRLAQSEWENAPRIRVDCDHHRERAEALLLRRARSRAERVQQTGRPLSMEPLNAYQRRLVHNELANMEGIHTESEETESRFKRITISRIS